MREGQGYERGPTLQKLRSGSARMSLLRLEALGHWIHVLEIQIKKCQGDRQNRITPRTGDFTLIPASPTQREP